jgi:hypothetical protein
MVRDGDVVLRCCACKARRDDITVQDFIRSGEMRSPSDRLPVTCVSECYACSETLGIRAFRTMFVDTEVSPP